MRTVKDRARRFVRTASLGAAAVLALANAASPSRAEVPSPLFPLVDAAAQRLQTANDVAASKWMSGGAIEDPAREKQVLDAVAGAAKERGVDPDYVAQVFRDQIDATVAVEYGLFSDWKIHAAVPPASAPNLSDSRGVIDRLNRTIVEQLAAQSVSLHAAQCPADLDAARTAVVRGRNLDALYERGLAYATHSYCR
jgi:chorismate mutase